MGNLAEIAHGPILIGFTFNAILLGVMVTQVYLYYTTFGNDKLWIKIFVAVLLFLDILNTAGDTAYLYESLIIHFGDTKYLFGVTWLFDMHPSITGFVVAMVQSFFAWRIRVLTKSWIWPLLIVATAITGGVTAILTPVQVAKAPNFVDLIQAKVEISIWLASEVLGDILITTILSKHKTGFERSDMLVDRIIRITIQTGMLTAIVALINLIVFLVDTSGLHLLFNFVLCKLYANSLMSTLNSRSVWMTGRSNGTSSGRDLESHTVSSHALHRPPVQLQQIPMKASDMINLTSQKTTEVYVNVESHELKDVNSTRSLQIPSARSDYDMEKNMYP